jgi:hypothetical protein
MFHKTAYIIYKTGGKSTERGHIPSLTAHLFLATFKIMGENEKEQLTAAAHPGPAPLPGRVNVRELASLSGGDALNFILDQDHPGEVVQGLSRVDFYWLVKQIGEDDAVPLLRLASAEQWEHVLDMETWQKDRVNLEQATSWVGRLVEADVGRLIQWLHTEGELFCFYYLFRSVQAEVRRGEELVDVPEGFFTFDNTYFIRVRDKEHEEMIANLLRRMAAQDYQRYQAVLIGLAGVLPADLEEELYRRRNVRLAEDGFLPFEEAISLYAYVKRDGVAADGSPYLLEGPTEMESDGSVPMLPFSQIRGDSSIVQAAGRILDPIFLDRLRLEFAGLCNRMISADQIRVGDLDDLVQVCRRAEGYLNVGLEEISRGRMEAAEVFLKSHPLVLLFQVGFSLTLELKWEAERWLEHSWSRKMGLDFGFWGDAWESMLEGVLHKRPLCFPEGEERLRHFEDLSEVHRCRAALEQVFAVDRLLEALDARHPMDAKAVRDPLATFHSFLFTFWARMKLDLQPGIEPLSIAQVKSFFQMLRKGREKAPFRMEPFKKPFVEGLIGLAEKDFFGETQREMLEGILSRLWTEFEENHAGVAVSDLDERFTRFLLIRTDPPSALH